MVSAGCNLRSLSGDESQAEADAMGELARAGDGELDGMGLVIEGGSEYNGRER